MVAQSTSPSSHQERSSGVAIAEVQGTFPPEGQPGEMQDELNLDTPLLGLLSPYASSTVITNVLYL